MSSAAPTFFSPVFALHRGTRKMVLLPTNRNTRERVQKYGEGAHLRATITQPRNLKHNALYWVILGNALEARGFEITTEDMHFKIKVAFVQQCRPDFLKIIKVFGEPFPQISTAFDKMDQQGFKEFFDFAMDLIRNHIMGGMTDEEWTAFTKHANNEGA